MTDMPRTKPIDPDPPACVHVTERSSPMMTTRVHTGHGETIDSEPWCPYCNELAGVDPMTPPDLDATPVAQSSA